MAGDSPELAEARDAVSAAVLRFARLRAAEVHDQADIVLEGYAVALEYTSVDLAQSDRSAGLSIVPNDQPRSMSIGLFTDAARHF